MLIVKATLFHVCFSLGIQYMKYGYLIYACLDILVFKQKPTRDLHHLHHMIWNYSEYTIIY
jgi:hypothetical protein